MTVAMQIAVPVFADWVSTCCLPRHSVLSSCSFTRWELTVCHEKKGRSLSCQPTYGQVARWGTPNSRCTDHLPEFYRAVGPLAKVSLRCHLHYSTCQLRLFRCQLERPEIWQKFHVWDIPCVAGVIPVMYWLHDYIIMLHKHKCN